MERSDSNDIVGTYFRPRRAAELIHQNKTLNCWKDYTKQNNRPLHNWMTPAALSNGISHPINIPWQPIPASATLQSLRNGNDFKTQDELRNKPFYGVRPTKNFLLNTNINPPLATPSINNNNFSYKSLNYPNYFNESGGGDRMLHTLRRPIAPVPFLREEMN